MSQKIRVTAPYVTLKVKDRDGADVVAGFYQGAVVDAGDVDKDSLRHHLDRDLVEKVPAAEAKAFDPASPPEPPKPAGKPS